MSKAHIATGLSFPQWKESSLKKIVEKELRSLANDIDDIFDYYGVALEVREDFTHLMKSRGIYPH
jgi:hypothetical protein